MYVPFALVVFASAFGSIHCLGWSFTFPSSTERTLWRFASVFVVGVSITLSLSSVPRLTWKRKYPNTLYFVDFILES